MKRVNIRKGLLHVETPLGIVNIYVGLTDRRGRKVETIEMIPTALAGEPMVVVQGRRFIQLKTVTRKPI